MPALHERLRFHTAEGEVKDADRRYVLMRADVLMGAFDALPSPARSQALEALARSVQQQGADSVRAYEREFGTQALLESVGQGAASLGWGCWTWTSAPGALQLQVVNSPFARMTQHHDGPACHAIAGMLAAVAGTLWSGPVDARETACACVARAHPFTCLFEAHPGPE
ncbi:putative hydrocarbon binding protein [Pseudacidovorax sp. 1753]|uniref:4-vinyl reductase n=1 Tax=Pseudacidovorax sp. 1753 TaxID=3156419 RepID=UPI0033980799